MQIKGIHLFTAITAEKKLKKMKTILLQTENFVKIKN